jgi:hypothetical protein
MRSGYLLVHVGPAYQLITVKVITITKNIEAAK